MTSATNASADLQTLLKEHDVPHNVRELFRTAEFTCAFMFAETFDKPMCERFCEKAGFRQVGADDVSEFTAADTGEARSGGFLRQTWLTSPRQAWNGFLAVPSSG